MVTAAEVRVRARVRAKAKVRARVRAKVRARARVWRVSGLDLHWVRAKDLAR